jgi:glycosyltransferase involved in cell wall biosynthesis
LAFQEVAFRVVFGHGLNGGGEFSSSRNIGSGRLRPQCKSWLLGLNGGGSRRDHPSCHVRLLHDGSADAFRLVRRAAAFRRGGECGTARQRAAIREMPEQTRFMKGIYHWVGFRQIGLPYDEEPRARGGSKYRPFRLVSFAFDGLTAFSNAPLKLWSALGAAIASASVLYAAYRVVRTLVYGVNVPGFESLMVAISFLGGLQLLSLGVLGSYIGRIFDEVKGRPLYIVRRIYRAGESAPAGAARREPDQTYPPAG